MKFTLKQLHYLITKVVKYTHPYLGDQLAQSNIEALDSGVIAISLLFNLIRFSWLVIFLDKKLTS